MANTIVSNMESVLLIFPEEFCINKNLKPEKKKQEGTHGQHPIRLN